MSLPNGSRDDALPPTCIPKHAQTLSGIVWVEIGLVRVSAIVDVLQAISSMENASMATWTPMDPVCLFRTCRWLHRFLHAFPRFITSQPALFLKLMGGQDSFYVQRTPFAKRKRL
eukprot:scaffold1424_cov359-Prasinococcus_capsulatus_cf.AAC.2